MSAAESRPYARKRLCKTIRVNAGTFSSGNALFSMCGAARRASAAPLPRFLEERRMNMRMLASAMAAAAFMGTASLAYAATDTGQITDINQTKHLIALDTGSTFMVPDRRSSPTLRSVKR